MLTTGNCNILYYPGCYFFSTSSQQLALDLHTSKQRQQQLHDNARQIKEDSHNIVLSVTKAVDKKVNLVLQDVTSQLSGLVDDFSEVDFDQQNLSVYKEVS